MQMLGRVRNLTTTTYHLHYQNTNLATMLLTIQDIDESIRYTVYRSCESLPRGVAVEMTDTDVVIKDSAYYQIYLHNTLEVNLSAYKPLFQLLKCTGLQHRLLMCRPLLKDARHGTTRELTAVRKLMLHQQF